MSLINVQQSLALFEMALVCTTLLMLLARYTFRPALPTQYTTSGVLMVLMLFPLGMLGLPLALPLAGYVRGFTGDFSIVTVLLLLSTVWLPTNQRIPIWFRGGVVLIGTVFYIGALGYGMNDPYAWGYGSLPFLLTIVGVGLCCWFAGWYRGVIILSLAVLAWCVGLHESGNMWDYVVDPYLWVGMIVSCYRPRNGSRIKR